MHAERSIVFKVTLLSHGYQIEGNIESGGKWRDAISSVTLSPWKWRQTILPKFGTKLLS